MILNDKEIKELIANQGFVKDYIDLPSQITPNGFDLTVEKIFTFLGGGQIGFTNQDRILPLTKELEWNNNTIHLSSGCYKVRTNETLKMPLNLVAIAMPRSSLLRCGVAINTGVWDAGFEGKSEFLLTVQNKDGFILKRNARVVQLTFIRTNEVGSGYNGIYNSR
ncbi:MAG: deoxyuridine 5'-triphosphate nucleotidohydrolase [Candidatus Bathyarchaeia archaeon]|jgi:dUTP pyrophosphatase